MFTPPKENVGKRKWTDEEETRIELSINEHKSPQRVQEHFSGKLNASPKQIYQKAYKMMKKVIDLFLQFGFLFYFLF